MAEEQEIVEVGNVNHNRGGATASQLSMPTSATRSFKLPAPLKSLYRRAISLPGTVVLRSVHPSSFAYSSTRIARMMQRRSEFASDLEFEIEASRVHWSELESASGATMERDLACAPHLTNAAIVERLRRQWPETGDFFRDYGDSLVLGEKIAEGAQAEIFEAKHAFLGVKYVLKVFKEGASLRDLQRQWPKGMLERTNGWYGSVYSSPIVSGTVVMNGRFAFGMCKYWGDLRKLIDLRIQRYHNRHPPFSNRELKSNMLQIAMGMQGLHKDNIIHRDLKSSNILISLLGQKEKTASNVVITLNRNGDVDPVYSSQFYTCQVADYECSVGVVGTGFWRAPEILRAVKNRNVTWDLFTEKSDVYSYAMTCYEMVTGKLPFEDRDRSDYDIVLSGNRPILPQYTKPWIKSLLRRCWHPDSLERPSFQEIIECISNEDFYNPILCFSG